MATRPAEKAGRWYLRDAGRLADMLNGFLATVPETIHESKLPIPGARMVIAPHAGYDYSGNCAAWAYSCLDLTRAKRVFVLGPSHTYAFRGCAVSSFAKYATPLGDLTVDRPTVERIKQAGDMDDIPRVNDVEEHSLEMHMPYLYRCFQKTFASPDQYPTIVPVLVGDNDLDEEKDVGAVLLPYLKDADNAFVVSSDFCHWGANFRYMVYSADSSLRELTTLSKFGPPPPGAAIHESIGWLDRSAMDAVESGKHDAFVADLRRTKNTVCGRHPIGVAMAALELLAKEAGDESAHRFRVVDYQRSNEVKQPADTSVSYVSAYAVL